MTTLRWLLPLTAAGPGGRFSDMQAIKLKNVDMTAGWCGHPTRNSSSVRYRQECRQGGKNNRKGKYEFTEMV
jgi:hypothetical protein